MPKNLCLDHVDFAGDIVNFDVKHPYVHCVLTSLTKEDALSSLRSLENSEMATVMVYLGLLLLQIELGQPLPFTEEEMSEKYGHEFALERYIQEFKGDLDDRLHHVLNNCLNFESCLEGDSYRTFPGDLRIKLAVAQNILEPLSQALAFNFPGIAAEIIPSGLQNDQDSIGKN